MSGNIVKSDNLKISGMNDEACAEKVSQTLRAISGVNAVTVSLVRMEAAVQYDEKMTTRQDLQASLVLAGYGVDAAAPQAGGCCGACGG